MKHDNLKIYFFPDGQEAYDPSSRYRCFNIYREFVKNNVDCVLVESPFGFSFDFYSFFRKLFTIFRITLKRHFCLVKTVLNLDKKKNNYLFLQRGLNVGTVSLVLFSRFFYKFKVIFDLDDAIFYLDFLKGRVDKMLKFCDIVVVGSHYLQEYAIKLNKNVYLIPTSLDLAGRYSKQKLFDDFDDKLVKIGWIGSYYNLKYLNVLVESLNNLAKKYSLEIIIIGPKQKPKLEFSNLIKINYIIWNDKTEIDDLLKIDIGVMPLFDSNVERGKCAFKAIQYMALGIPTVASSVGENNYLIQDGQNGFLASNSKEWEEKIEKLILDANLRNKFSIEAKKRIIDNYSLDKNALKLLEIIENNLSFKRVS